MNRIEIPNFKIHGQCILLSFVQRSLNIERFIQRVENVTYNVQPFFLPFRSKFTSLMGQRNFRSCPFMIVLRSSKSHSRIKSNRVCFVTSSRCFLTNRSVNMIPKKDSYLSDGLSFCLLGWQNQNDAGG